MKLKNIKLKDMKFKIKEVHILLLVLATVFILFSLLSSSVVNQYNSIKTGRIVAVKSTSKHTDFYNDYEIVVEFEDNQSLVTLNNRTLSDDLLFEIYEVAKDNIEEDLNFKVEVLEYDDGVERYEIQGLSYAQMEG